MSQWTHINASIRFDGIIGFGTAEPDLGITCSYEDEEEQWNKCDVPCGSEGSMQYMVWKNPSQSSLAFRTVVFWGDLRSYSNVEEILTYFNRITEGQMIRSGILEIDVEFKDTLAYQYVNKVWELINTRPYKDA